MIIFIRKYKTLFPNIPCSISSVEFQETYNLGIKFPDLIVLPITKTSSDWFKILLLEYLHIDLTQKIIEWKIIQDDSSPLYRSSSSEINIEIHTFFDKFHHLALHHNKLVSFPLFLTEFLLMIQEYLLNIITFKTIHISLLEEVIKKQLQIIQQLEEDIVYDQSIFSQNIKYITDKLTFFSKCNLANYTEAFRDHLITNVKILLRYVMDKLEFNQQELDHLKETKLKNSFIEKQKEREHWFNLLNIYTMVEKTFSERRWVTNERKLSSNSIFEMQVFETIWNEFIKIKNKLDDKFTKIKLAFSVKQKLELYLKHLKQIKGKKESVLDSLSCYYESKFFKSTFNFKTISESIELLLTNPFLSLHIKYNQFVTEFFEICTTIEKNEELWDFNHANFKESSNCESSIPIKNEIYKNNALLKQLKIFFQDHISEMCLELLRYIYVPPDYYPTVEQFLWQCYENYLSSEQIFKKLKTLFTTIFSDSLHKLQEIIQNPASINIPPDLLQSFCSDPLDHHYLNSETISKHYKCKFFQKFFLKSLLYIQETSNGLSFTKVYHTLETIYDSIENSMKVKMNSRLLTLEDIMPVIELLYIHCTPDVFTNFFITLTILDVFLPSIFTTFEKAGHRLQTFYAVYILFLDEYNAKTTARF